MDKKIFIAIGIIAIFAISFALIKSRIAKNKVLNIPYVGPNGDLSKVKVAALYEKVTERELVGGRSIEQTIAALKQINTDMIFRGFWIWNLPALESPDEIPPELAALIAERLKIEPDKVPEVIRKSGFSYQELANSVSVIKKACSAKKGKKGKKGTFLFFKDF